MTSSFETLKSINVNDKTEKKEGLTYLSWAWAWDVFKQNLPDAQYEIVKFDGLPYVNDPATGYMVYTRITANGETHEMWLPVMNGANKAMRSHPYEYQVWDSYKKDHKKKFVEAATMFDINKTIMRCLTKNMAMFGLGLYIYAGEDLPEGEESEKKSGRLSDDKGVKEDMKDLGYDEKKVYDEIIEELDKVFDTHGLELWVKRNKEGRRTNGMSDELRNDIKNRYNTMKNYLQEKGL